MKRVRMKLIYGALAFTLGVFGITNVILSETAMLKVGYNEGSTMQLINKENTPSIHHKFNPSSSKRVSTMNDGSESGIEKEFHIVFSTGCSPFQDWQSYVFFYQIYKSGQSGHVTRVASGCDKDTGETLRRLFQEQINHIPTGERFHLHLTPDFSTVAGDKKAYKFFNKPYGLQHWMHNGLGFPDKLDQYSNVIFTILDPDQFLLRPFQVDYTNDASAVWHDSVDETEFKIKAGRPFAQFYAFGGGWVKQVNTVEGIESVVNATGDTTSHLHEWSLREVTKSYTAGPPYIAVAADMYSIVDTWAKVAISVYKLTDDHLSEMYAYSTAAAHLNLPHQLAVSFMISNPMIEKEGWNVIDATSPEQICRSDSEHTTEFSHNVPQVLHYCQRYFVGPYFFGKYKLPKNFLSCDHPLMVDPAEIEGGVLPTKYDSSITPNGDFNALSPVQAQRQAFFLCHTIPLVNDAATYWKKQHCDLSTANLTKAYMFPKDKPKKAKLNVK